MPGVDRYALEIDESSVRRMVKTDLHVHAESTGRLLQAIEQRRGRERTSHRDLIERHMRDTAPRTRSTPGSEP